jgi:DNA polymerase III subunit beta
MQIEFDRARLLAAFNTAAAVVPARSPKVVLQNVKLETSPSSGTTLSATDGEVEVRVALPECIPSDPHGGAVLLPPARFQSILREAVGSTVKLSIAEALGSPLVIQAGRSEFKFPLADPTEFPAMRPFGLVGSFWVAAPALAELLARTAFATDTASTRYALGGVFFERIDDTLAAVGTDGRRLAVAEAASTGYESDVPAVAGHNTALLPTKAARLLERILPDKGDSQALVRFDATTLGVVAGDVTFTARLLEGRFPRWQDVLPGGPPAGSVQLLSGSFASALRQAAITTDESTQGVDMAFSDAGQVTLGCEAATSGKSRVELPISYQGESVSITLDPRYVLDFFKAAPHAPNTLVELRGSDKAAVFSVAGYRYVVMPLARER